MPGFTTSSACAEPGRLVMGNNFSGCRTIYTELLEPMLGSAS
jgi:hypothetical protein